MGTVFNIFFGLAATKDNRGYKISTKRGGMKPVITRLDGSIITKKDLVDDGYKLGVISESRNPYNEAQLEDVAHRDVKYKLKREVGVRLNLKCGGANYKDIGDLYGVYILYNLKGLNKNKFKLRADFADLISNDDDDEANDWWKEGEEGYLGI